MTLEPTKFLNDLTGRYAKAYTEAVEDMLIAKAVNNKVAYSQARTRLEKVITETMGVAEVLGASLTLERASGEMHFAVTATQSILPRVTLSEAVEDMIARTPVTLQNAAERTAQKISELYSEGHVTAFVRSAEVAVTGRVKSLITQAIHEGIPELDFMVKGRLQPGAGSLMVEAVNKVRGETKAWSEGYSRMAFRTNVNTAVTAGRFRQAQDPAIGGTKDQPGVIPAFRFDAVGDSDTRANHGAADGLIFGIYSDKWNKIAPPLGYSCRCRISFVSLPMLRRMGRIDSSGRLIEDRRIPRGAHPDPGFRHGGRPDLFLNGVAG